MTTLRSAISDDNTTFEPLGALGVFTGKLFNVRDFSTITVFLDSDVDGSLSMEFSADGVNWDRRKVVALDSDISSGSVHTLEVVSEYFRVVYTNGSVAQTHLRIQTIVHANRSGFLTSSVDEVINRSNDAQLVRVANDPFADYSRGLYGDKQVIHKFGANDSSPSGTERDIWAYGATTNGDVDYNWLQAAIAVRVQAGGNVNDTAAGTGARTILIDGLDENWNQATETVTLAGSGASAATTTTFIRVNRAYVATTGTYTGANTGDVIIETTAGTVVAFIGAGIGQTQLSNYTVPDGYTAYVRHAHGSVSAGASKDATLVMYRRDNADDVSAPHSGVKRLIHKWEQLQGIAELDFYAMPAFGPRGDIWWTATGSAITAVSVVYDLLLVKSDSPTNPQ